MAFLPFLKAQAQPSRPAQQGATRPRRDPAADPLRPTRPTSSTNPPRGASPFDRVGADAISWRKLRSAAFDRLERATRARDEHAPTRKLRCSSRGPPATGIRPGLIKISQKRSQSEIDTWLSGFKVWKIVFWPPNFVKLHFSPISNSINSSLGF